MQVTVEVTDAGNELVQFKFTHTPRTADDTLAVLRAVARMSRALADEYHNIHGETEFIRREFIDGEEAESEDE